mgnify:CR=1 FL=1
MWHNGFAYDPGIFFVMGLFKFFAKQPRAIFQRPATCSLEKFTCVHRTKPCGEPCLAMRLATQLALFLDNKPGTFARVCEALAEAKINIYAIATSDTVENRSIFWPCSANSFAPSSCAASARA